MFEPKIFRFRIKIDTPCIISPHMSEMYKHEKLFLGKGVRGGGVVPEDYNVGISR